MNARETTCCIVGGGPAGVMLGLLLARQGVGVLVLEKHADFLRDFRGDTVHPSTLRIMDELGFSDEFAGRWCRCSWVGWELAALTPIDGLTAPGGSKDSVAIIAPGEWGSRVVGTGGADAASVRRGARRSTFLSR